MSALVHRIELALQLVVADRADHYGIADHKGRRAVDLHDRVAGYATARGDPHEGKQNGA